MVDFIHVSVWEGWVPEFVPFYGGEFVPLFPIWNVADMAIVGGVVGVLLFHHRFHEQEMKRLARESMGLVAVEPATVTFAMPPLRPKFSQAIADDESPDTSTAQTDTADNGEIVAGPEASHLA